MLQLVEFFSRNRNFIFFVLLEVLSFWLITQSNSYWGAKYFNTSNYYVAKTLTLSNSIREYMHLKDINEQLAHENLALNEQVARLKELNPVQAPAAYTPDSVFANRFEFIVSKVIMTETNRTNNYLTIDKGSADGIKPGMGVISATGVVGKVRSCSEHYSVVTSILHSQFMVSSRLVRSGEIGPARWQSKDPETISLMDISRYKKVLKGDSAVTSNYNSVFPPGIMVGTVKSTKIRPDQTFYDIDLKVATDFRSLSYVYVVQNRLQTEQDQLLKPIEEERQ
ncbi:rod shape-determining protein MreC [Arundinibacter roseus]|uniref:Cell shape-determining protein MreC n=1 Tax=Arundinibacter roseus TaxID=2070510 RepID=A0A4R4KKV1_9BACT|nr:rod shape-determining protein MreC [Arundinibacter roseus]TDB68927.1 rod shape-determining protein MreC [Arundinibacter roseus]